MTDRIVLAERDIGVDAVDLERERAVPARGTVDDEGAALRRGHHGAGERSCERSTITIASSNRSNALLGHALGGDTQAELQQPFVDAAQMPHPERFEVDKHQRLRAVVYIAGQPVESEGEGIGNGRAVSILLARAGAAVMVVSRVGCLG